MMAAFMRWIVRATASFARKVQAKGERHEVDWANCRSLFFARRELDAVEFRSTLAAMTIRTANMACMSMTMPSPDAAAAIGAWANGR
jgi:hypothetical protein